MAQLRQSGLIIVTMFFRTRSIFRRTSSLKGLHAPSPSLLPFLPRSMPRTLRQPPRDWGVRCASFVLWAVVGVSGVFWGLKWVSPPPAPARYTTASSATVQPPSLLSLVPLFGAHGGRTNAAPADAVPGGTASDKLQLLGVVSGGDAGNRSVALIALRDAPPKPYALGAIVADQWRVVGVERERVRLKMIRLPAEGGQAQVVLHLPAAQ
jgi:Type II secretion system protein C